jgi:hypothetical protein
VGHSNENLSSINSDLEPYVGCLVFLALLGDVTVEEKEAEDLSD